MRSRDIKRGHEPVDTTAVSPASTFPRGACGTEAKRRPWSGGGRPQLWGDKNWGSGLRAKGLWRRGTVGALSLPGS